jgi:hypothetical protein
LVGKAITEACRHAEEGTLGSTRSCAPLIGGGNVAILGLTVETGCVVAAFVGGFDELVDELGAGGVADSAGLFAGGDAKSDQQMGLAAAGVAEQHDRVAGVEVAAGGESLPR